MATMDSRIAGVLGLVVTLAGACGGGGNMVPAVDGDPGVDASGDDRDGGPDSDSDGQASTCDQPSSTGWITEIVASGEQAVAFAELGFTGDGRLVAMGAEAGEVHYYVRDGGVWQSANLTAAASFTRPKLAIDATGTMHAVFVDGDHAVRHAVLSGAAFTLETVAENAGYATAIAATPDGGVKVAYFVGEEVRLAEKVAGTWQSTTIDVRRFGQPSDICLAIDGDGHYHIAFEHRAHGFVYATDAPRAWQRTVVDELGDWCAMAIFEDQLSVALLPESNTFVSYATDQSGVPFIEAKVPDKGPEARHVGLVMAADGPHLGFGRHGGLPVHAYVEDGMWGTEVIDSDPDIGWPYWEAAGVDLAIAADGTLWAIYGDATGRELRAARRCRPIAAP